MFGIYLKSNGYQVVPPKYKTLADAKSDLNERISKWIAADTLEIAEPGEIEIRKYIQESAATTDKPRLEVVR